MNKRQIINIIAEFMNTEINTDSLKENLADILFTMRQNNNHDETRSLLSKFQLYIHEYDEGRRDIHEIYITAQEILDILKPNKKQTSTKFQSTSIIPSSPGDVYSTTDSPAPEFDEVPTTVPIG